jgi:hypothetical protein
MTFPAFRTNTLNQRFTHIVSVGFFIVVMSEFTFSKFHYFPSPRFGTLFPVFHIGFAAHSVLGHRFSLQAF